MLAADLVPDVIYTHVITVHIAIFACVKAQTLAGWLPELGRSGSAHLLRHSGMADVASIADMLSRLHAGAKQQANVLLSVAVACELMLGTLPCCVYSLAMVEARHQDMRPVWWVLSPIL